METAAITDLSRLLNALVESPEQFTDEGLTEVSDLAELVRKHATKSFVDRLIARTRKD